MALLALYGHIWPLPGHLAVPFGAVLAYMAILAFWPKGLKKGSKTVFLRVISLVLRVIWGHLTWQAGYPLFRGVFDPVLACFGLYLGSFGPNTPFLTPFWTLFDPFLGCFGPNGPLINHYLT